MGNFSSQINLPRKQEALREACIQGPKGVGETSSRPTLVTKKGDSIHPTWTTYNLKWQILDSLALSFIPFFMSFSSFSSFSWRKKAAKISTVDVFPETARQDLLDDPEGSQGFCLLNNVAIGAAYASGYPYGFPENEGWNKDKIPPCHDKRFFSNFCALTSLAVRAL